MRFILRRLGFYLIAFWASITLNFLLPRFMPGDPPVSRMFARSQDRMQPEQIEALRKLLGVDDRPFGSNTSTTCTTSSPGKWVFPSPVSPPPPSPKSSRPKSAGHFCWAVPHWWLPPSWVTCWASWPPGAVAARSTRRFRRCWFSSARSRTSGLPWVRCTCSVWCWVGSRSDMRLLTVWSRRSPGSSSATSVPTLCCPR